MKHIKIIEQHYELKAMYRHANELSERALLGYILKAGLTNDVIYGAAFAVLKSVNRCTGLYKLVSYCDSKENEKKILWISELALDGEFDDFALSRSEIDRTLKRLNEY